jgi:hypothetical protein
VLAVVICINMARGGLARERRIRLAAAGVIMALVILAAVHVGG